MESELMNVGFLNSRVQLRGGDCLAVIKTMADNSIDSVVTDPPYALGTIAKRFGGVAMDADTQTSADARSRSTSYARLSGGFMGKKWDTGETAFAVEFWHEVLRVIKPGGHVAAFGGTRSYHRLACAIEDAGFEIRDQLAWVYGTGFPKSHSVSKGIESTLLRGSSSTVAMRQTAMGADYEPYAGAGNFRDGTTTTKNSPNPPGAIFSPTTDAAKQWEGWGTALKPSWEPIALARKPLSEKTVAANVLKWGTGAINIDASRVETTDSLGGGDQNATTKTKTEGWDRPWMQNADAKAAHAERVNANVEKAEALGRWPANLLHDGSAEVVAMFPTPHGAGHARAEPGGGTYDGSSGIGFAKDGSGIGVGLKGFRIGDSGSAARFFYCAKAGEADRAGSKHPTVKPVKLMQWLCKLITPPGGTILDPFAGTGTTAHAAFLAGFPSLMIEREAEYLTDIATRMGGLARGLRDDVVVLGEAA